MSFFSNFPKTEYDIYRTGELQRFIDYFRLVDVNDLLANSSASYTYYDILESERPDVVSQKLYGTPDFYWTFFIVNDHLKDGYQKWPKSRVALDKTIKEKFDDYIYVSLSNSQTNTASGGLIQSALFNFPLNKFSAIRNKSNGELAFFKGYNDKTYDAIFKPINGVEKFIGRISETNEGYSAEIGYPEFINPYNIFSDEYAQTEAERAIYLSNISNWFIGSTEYDNYLQSLQEAFAQGTITSTTPTDDGIYNYLQGENMIAFNNFQRGENAAAYYIDNDGVEISSFQASHPESVLNSNDDAYTKLIRRKIQGKNIVTNREHEEKENDALTKIKVIRPSRISDFAKQYKDLINE